MRGNMLKLAKKTTRYEAKIRVGNSPESRGQDF